MSSSIMHNVMKVCCVALCVAHGKWLKKYAVVLVPTIIFHRCHYSSFHEAFELY